MGAEKGREGKGQDKDATHVVQATDRLGRTVSRDPFKSHAEAEAHADNLCKQGHKVEVSPLEPRSK